MLTASDMNVQFRKQVASKSLITLPQRRTALAEQVARIDGQLQRFVREQPLLAAGMALSAGYLLGRLLARR
ncbi:MAG TPA: DUF883 C-terminal domain-containing protein [Polyangiales bacterium]